MLHLLIAQVKYSKASRSLSQYYRYEPALNNDDVIIGFPAYNSKSISFKFKQQMTRQTGKNEMLK